MADSLALPRGTEVQEEIVYWENTWPAVLERMLRAGGHEAEVINCGARDRTCESLSGAQFYEHIVLKRPDIVVVQVGIADCAPRIFSRFEKRLLGLPFVPARLRNAIIRSRSARRAKLTRKNPLAKVHVPPARFKKSLDAFARQVAELPNSLPIVFVPVVGYAPQMDVKSPGFSENIALYNSLLQEFVARSNFYGIEWTPTRADFWEDGHHLSVVGNRSLAGLLYAFLSARNLLRSTS